MPAVYEGHGLRFQFPESWQLEENDTDDGWSLSVTSENTAYVQLVGQPTPEIDLEEGIAAELAENPSEDPLLLGMMAAATEALREDYPDLELESILEGKIGGIASITQQAHFISFDISVTCTLFCVRTPTQIVLILCQASDLEESEAEPMFAALVKSLRWQK